MGWLGFIVLTLHYMQSDAKWLQGLIGFLKWVCLAVGIMQAIGFLMVLNGEAQLNGDQQGLLLLWAAGNLGAFFAVRAAENDRDRRKRGLAK